jgi:predicted O-methyltransferase YrrM
MSQPIEPMRPLAPLYRPEERFEISAVGLEAWYRSEAFKRVAAFYRSYPSRSVFQDNGRALLHHLIVVKRPERVLEIGTMYAGTSEVLARAVWEVGRSHIETIDPYGAERCPALIADLPRELRDRISFFPESSALHLDQAIQRGSLYDLVFIDGNHELEFALFDLECIARLMRPGGFVVLDNIEQVGPRFAAKMFLERHPEWIDVAGVIGRIAPEAPLAEPPPSFPDTKTYLLQAPPHYAISSIPRSFGSMQTDRGSVDSVTLDLVGPISGTLHLQIYIRTFGLVHPEEKTTIQSVQLAENDGPLIVPLSQALRSEVNDRPHATRQTEIILAFTGNGCLALRDRPIPYPAKYL